MLYLFAGDDAKNKLKSYDNFIKSIPKGTETFFISYNDFDKREMERFYSGGGLFFQRFAVFYENIFEREEVLNTVLDKLSEMHESENIFVFLDGKQNKPVLDAFKKARAELNIFELPKEKKEKFNNFLLANAFGDRDKLNLWIYFRQAIDKGVGMEELIGVLFWKIKDMLLKKSFGKFSEAELQACASKISYLLPEARKQGNDAEAAFEQFLLEAF
ncbi:MAG: hypothetical protein KBC06_01675 [Candidatus Pacebacteria bacterium]|nr:hypothetical protein [Candidatus Paceibacterota bacterium]